MLGREEGETSEDEEEKMLRGVERGDDAGREDDDEGEE